MGGGLMQLVAYGAQDVYLSGNPQITFFKVVYRRHTNFAVEPIQQTWNGAADFGRTVTCNINRNGDLITNMYIAVILKNLSASDAGNAAWGYVSRLGHAMFSSVKIEIGGSKIDEHWGDWMNIWVELTCKTGQLRGYNKMIGNVPELTNVVIGTKRSYQLYVPCQFWFCRNNGLALPLIALQYHDVRITVYFRDQMSVINYNSLVPTFTQGLMQDSYLLIDYIYLDSEERKRFAQASHEYLIEQLQFTGSETLNSASMKYRLNFNHPSKYLVWAPHLQQYNTRNTWISYAFDGKWDAAKDRFAKIIAGACVLGVNYTSTGITFTGDATVSKGDVIDPVLTIPSGSGITASLLSKIEARFIVGSAPTIVGPATTGSWSIATGTIDYDVINSYLDSVILVRNNLSWEDISLNLTSLLGSITSGNVYTFLNLFSQNAIDVFNYGNFVNGTDNPVADGKLQLNGHDRFQVRDGYYFNYVQPFQHFSNTPADGINVYSFALKPEDHQPSGTCNFSRIDNATLQVDFGTYNQTNSSYASTYLTSSANSLLNIYTVNYNVLRVMSGMAGTAYSN